MLNDILEISRVAHAKQQQQQKNQGQVTSYVPWQEAGSNPSHTSQSPSGL